MDLIRHALYFIQRTIENNYIMVFQSASRPTGLAGLAGFAGLAGLAGLFGLAGLAGLAGLVGVSHSHYVSVMDYSHSCCVKWRNTMTVTYFCNYTT